MTKVDEAVMVKSNTNQSIAQACCAHNHLLTNLPEDGWFGVSLGWPSPVLGSKWVFGYVFTEVSSGKRQPQHGRQRGIVEHDANLTDKEQYELMYKGTNDHAFIIDRYFLHPRGGNSGCFFNFYI